MCSAQRNLSLKARVFLVTGNLCLVASLVLSTFAPNLGHQHAALYDCLRGFLLGLAIPFNFAAFRLSRNCPQKQA